MSNLTLEANRHIFNWPLKTDVPDQALIEIVGAKVYDDGVRVPDVTIHVSRDNFQYQKPQSGQVVMLSALVNGETLTLPIHIDLVDPKRADYQPGTASSNSYHAPAQPRRKAKWLWAIIVLLLVGIVALSLNSCHQKQINQQQDNQISSLKSSNQNLSKQLDELKNAVDDYKSDQNQQALTNRLNQIQQELQNQNGQTAQIIKNAIDHIQTDPNNAQKYLNQINTDPSFWQNLQDQFQAWLNAHKPNQN